MSIFLTNPVSGAISITSGEVHVMSGAIAANVSGGVTISGGVNVSGMVGVSGNVAVISGAISVISGSITINSGQVAISGLFAGFSGAQKFLSGGIAVSGAIPVVPVIYDFSGSSWNQMYTPGSGLNAIVTTPATQAYVWAPLSGIGFGAGATNSGIPSLSGGVNLSSGRVNIAIVRNLSGNADMYVGGSGSRPFSGFGFVLHGGDGLTLPLGNFNQIYVFANTSGQLVSYIGTAFN